MNVKVVESTGIPVQDNRIPIYIGEFESDYFDIISIDLKIIIIGNQYGISGPVFAIYNRRNTGSAGR